MGYAYRFFITNEGSMNFMKIPVGKNEMERIFKSASLYEPQTKGDLGDLLKIPLKSDFQTLISLEKLYRSIEKPVTRIISDFDTHTCRETLLGAIRLCNRMGHRRDSALFAANNFMTKVVYTITGTPLEEVEHINIIQDFINHFPALFTSGFSYINVQTVVEEGEKLSVCISTRVLDERSLYFLSSILLLLRSPFFMKLAIEKKSGQLVGLSEEVRHMAKILFLDESLDSHVAGFVGNQKVAMFLYMTAAGVNPGASSNGPQTFMSTSYNLLAVLQAIKFFGLNKKEVLKGFYDRKCRVGTDDQFLEGLLDVAEMMGE